MTAQLREAAQELLKLTPDDSTTDWNVAFNKLHDALSQPEPEPVGEHGAVYQVASTLIDGRPWAWRDAHGKEYVEAEPAHRRVLYTAPPGPVGEQPDTFRERNAKFREENWQIRFDAAVEARRQAQEQLYAERERYAAEIQALRQELSRALLARTAKPEPVGEREAFEQWWPTVGQTIGKVAAWESWQARALLARTSAPAAEQADSYEDIWQALMDITTAACAHPLFEVLHDGGIKEATKNIIALIEKTAAAEQAEPVVKVSAIERNLRTLMRGINSYEKATGIGESYAEFVQTACNSLLRACGSPVTFGIGHENPEMPAQHARELLTPAELDLCLQWFDAVQDLNAPYLTKPDYMLAEKLYRALEMRVPSGITAQAGEKQA